MKILAIAYACEPGEGSEPGAGWAWSRMLAQLGETWVITRANNKAAIEAARSSLDPAERARFLYVDLPPWTRFWKRGQRGVRLYYLLWQISALRVARQTARERAYDIVWHVTFANIWLGSVGSLVGSVFVYGPVGGGTGSCWAPQVVGLKGEAFEALRAGAAAIARYLNPLARLSWRNAALILANNEDTVRWIPRRYRPKAQLMPNVALDLTPRLRAPGHRKHVAVFAGRLIPWKGGSLAIQSLRYLSDWNLVICGTGPDESRLRRLAEELGVADRVRFRGWVSREALLEFLSTEADVLLLPSLHDQAPWIVGESLTLGVPAICLDRGGPPALGATCVQLDGVEETAKSLAAAALQGSQEPLPNWNMASRFEVLKQLLQRRGIIP